MTPQTTRDICDKLVSTQVEKLPKWEEMLFKGNGDIQAINRHLLRRLHPGEAVEVSELQLHVVKRRSLFHHLLRVEHVVHHRGAILYPRVIPRVIPRVVHPDDPTAPLSCATGSPPLRRLAALAGWLAGRSSETPEFTAVG